MTQVRRRNPAPFTQGASCCGSIEDLLDPELFKSLCDPTRTRMLARLITCGRACSVTEVAECDAVDLSVVSRHLKMLERAGVLELTKSGRSVSYEVRYEHLCRTLRELADAIERCRPAEQAAKRTGGARGKR